MAAIFHFVIFSCSNVLVYLPVWTLKKRKTQTSMDTCQEPHSFPAVEGGASSRAGSQAWGVGHNVYLPHTGSLVCVCCSLLFSLFFESVVA